MAYRRRRGFRRSRRSFGRRRVGRARRGRRYMTIGYRL